MGAEVKDLSRDELILIPLPIRMATHSQTLSHPVPAVVPDPINEVLGRQLPDHPGLCLQPLILGLISTAQDPLVRAAHPTPQALIAKHCPVAIAQVLGSVPSLMAQRRQHLGNAVIQVALAHHNPSPSWVIKPQQVFLAAVSQPLAHSTRAPIRRSATSSIIWRSPKA